MRQSRSKRILAAQFSKEHAALIREISTKRGETISSFLRRSTLQELARLSYLAPGEKKALGQGAGD